MSNIIEQLEERRERARAKVVVNAVLMHSMVKAS